MKNVSFQLTFFITGAAVTYSSISKRWATKFRDEECQLEAKEVLFLQSQVKYSAVTEPTPFM